MVKENKGKQNGGIVNRKEVQNENTSLLNRKISLKKVEPSNNLSQKIQILHKEKLFLSPFSKKIKKLGLVFIQKSSNRKPFQNITNIQDQIQDPIKLNYEPNLQSINCYIDKELNIPEKWTHKIINQLVDNDVTTDEDQIKNAVKLQKKQIEDAIDNIKKQQQISNSQKL